MNTPEILLGEKWNPRTSDSGGAETYDLRSHITLIAPTGTGKGATLEIPNLLLGLRDMSVFSIDPSGQNAAVCAKARRKQGSQTLMLNPFNLHRGWQNGVDYSDMEDVGCNPLMALDPKSPKFFEDAMALGDAAIAVENNDHQKHFPESARGLLTWLMMYARILEGDSANLGTVRDMLTGDLPKVARAAIATGNQRIASLAGKWRGDLTNELQSVFSTAETQTTWLLSDEMRASLEKNGVGDFGRLKDRRTSIFVILPAGIELENHEAWMRIMVTSALNALYRRGAGGVMTLFLLSEFAQLGKLKPITSALGQGRKYGIRVWPVLQDMGQLTDMYGKDRAMSFIANSSCVVGLTPQDPDTAKWMSDFSGMVGKAVPSFSGDPQTGQPRESVSIKEERVWSADKIREVPEFHGLIWKAGKSQPQPVYLEPYFKNPACLRVARQDPYHTGAAAAPTKQAKGGAGVYFTLAALGAGLWFWQHNKPVPRGVLVAPPAPAQHHAKHHPARADDVAELDNQNR